MKEDGYHLPIVNVQWIHADLLNQFFFFFGKPGMLEVWLLR